MYIVQLLWNVCSVRWKSEYTVVIIKVTMKEKIKPVFQRQTSLFNESAQVWGMYMFVHFKRLKHWLWSSRVFKVPKNYIQGKQGKKVCKTTGFRSLSFSSENKVNIQIKNLRNSVRKFLFHKKVFPSGCLHPKLF